MGLAVVVVAAGFGTAENLADAYGMAVTLTMLITSALITFVAARWCLKSGRPALLLPLAPLMGCLLTLDGLLASSCALKFVNGAWFPVAVAAVLFFFMSTWARGSALLRAAVRDDQPPLAPFLAWLAAEPVQRTPRVAVYAVADTDVVPPALLLNLRHYKVRHAARQGGARRLRGRRAVAVLSDARADAAGARGVGGGRCCTRSTWCSRCASPRRRRWGRRSGWTRRSWRRASGA